MPPLKRNQHPDKAGDVRLRATLVKAGRSSVAVDKLDLSTRRARLVALGTSEQAYRDAGGTVED